MKPKSNLSFVGTFQGNCAGFFLCLVIIYLIPQQGLAGLIIACSWEGRAENRSALDPLGIEGDGNYSQTRFSFCQTFNVIC